MYEPQSATPIPQAQPRASYAALLGETMMLVACALAVLSFGVFVGQDLSPVAARNCFIVGVGMLFAQNWVKELRYDTVGTLWLMGLALALGLGLGPALMSYVNVEPDAVFQAAAMTGVAVLGAGLYGTMTSHDLAKWMQPVSLIVFVAVVISWLMFAVGSPANALVSGVIGLFSAALIVIDFNYLHRRADRDDVVWLATGIFVSIINIFLTILRFVR
jgi:modulator of FtsH protease